MARVRSVSRCLSYSSEFARIPSGVVELLVSPRTYATAPKNSRFSFQVRPEFDLAFRCRLLPHELGGLSPASSDSVNHFSSLRLTPHSEKRFVNPELAVKFGESSAGCWFVSWSRLSFAIKSLLTAHSKKWTESAVLRTARSALDKPYSLMSSSRRANICVIRLSVYRETSQATFDIPKNISLGLNLFSGSVRLPAYPYVDASTPRSLSVD